MNFELRQLNTLATVLQEKSFERAAQRLFITQSAVSQRIRQLEDQLGQVLIVRSSPLRATYAGVQLLKYFRQVSQLQDDLMQQLAASSVADERWKSIAIGLNADSLATWFFDAMTPLLAQEKLVVELKVDDQDITHELLRTGEVLGCISSIAEPIQGCHCTPLGIMIYRCLASKEFVERYFGEVNALADGSPSMLKKAPAIEYNEKDHMQENFSKEHFGLEPGSFPIHRIPSAEGYLDLVVRGFGYGMVPDLMSAELMEGKKLIDLKPGTFVSVPLYWHIWNLQTDLNARLTRALTAAASRLLLPIQI